MFYRRLILAVVYNAVAYGGTLFSIAGTFDWWRAWVFLGVIELTTIGTMLGVLRQRQDLLIERFKGVFQRGQPLADRLVMAAFLVGYSGLLILTPFDACHLHLLSKPGILVSSMGLALFVGGCWLVALSFRDNAFAVRVIRHQTERQHVVVDSGVYSIVRHPMYAGVVMLLLGMPLWLESYAAALFALVPIAILMVRILVEERFLRRELAGYEAYLQRVRYRLVPHVW